MQLLQQQGSRRSSESNTPVHPHQPKRSDPPLPGDGHSHNYYSSISTGSGSKVAAAQQLLSIPDYAAIFRRAGVANEQDLCDLFDSVCRAPTSFLFQVTRPHTDVFLVVRVEKVLQGSIASAAEPYLRDVGGGSQSAADMKLAQKQFKLMRTLCASIPQYRMPFAWGAVYALFLLLRIPSEFPCV